MRERPSSLLLPALLALCLGGGSGSPLLFVSGALGGVLLNQTPVQAQSAEAVAKIAQAITVRIEGATQGSGVLVKREGNRYTVLTAWHVVSGQRPGEELDIYTADGQKYPLQQGSIKRLGDVDMAVLAFTSPNTYEVAQIGDAKSVSMGNQIFVSGFPLATPAVPTRVMRFIDGKVIANISVDIPNGYQLLYSNLTLQGMSGGPVLDSQGFLVGIHGQGEIDAVMSEQQGVAIKTGTNQAIPISYYTNYMVRAVATTEPSVRPDSTKRLASRNTEECADAILSEQYFLEGNSMYKNGDYFGAISVYGKSIACYQQNAFAFNNRGAAKMAIGDTQGAIADFTAALSIDPSYYNAIQNLAEARQML